MLCIELTSDAGELKSSKFWNFDVRWETPGRIILKSSSDDFMVSQLTHKLSYVQQTMKIHGAKHSPPSLNLRRPFGKKSQDPSLVVTWTIEN